MQVYNNNSVIVKRIKYIFLGILFLDVHGNQMVQHGSDEFTLSVDYSRTLEQMIAAGNYDSKSSNINSHNFPLPIELTGKSIALSAKIFNFGKNISNNEVVAAMDKAGYRPAALAELLALGESQPELQKQYQIVALKSVLRDDMGYFYVPYLGGNASERYLQIISNENGWDANYHFLAILR